MRRFLLLTLFSINLIASATDYYVKNGGNDQASGTSDASAWATINKVNSFAFKPGDRILFKSGDKWQEQKQLIVKNGNSNAAITYSSYGSGPKPLILGSKQENSVSDWINVGNNLWRNNDLSFSVDVGNIIFNNEESCGVRVKSLDQVNSQGKYFYDKVNKNITLYSTSNPAIYYKNIECALDKSIIGTSGAGSYVIIDGFDLRYTSRHAIVTSNNSHHITIRNCDIFWIGGSLTSDGSIRLGNGIEFWGNHSNMLVEKNYIDHVYDAGISTQYYNYEKVNVHNLIIRYNIINRCEFSFEMIYACSSGEVDKVFFENNTCLNAGMCWSHNQRWSVAKGYHVSSSAGNNAIITNYYIRNNIFSFATQGGMIHQQIWPVNNIVWDNNLYFVNTIARVSNTYYPTLTQWQNTTKQDKNSISADPKFISPTDFHLQPTSPAINAGVNVGYIEDFDGNPIVGLPDIGAFEYQPAATPAVPVYQNSVIENNTPSQLIMTYDRTLANKIPPVSAFTVMVNSIARAVSSVVISGTKAVLNLASPVAYGDVVTVSYTKPASNPLQTPAGGQAESITTQTVTNNIKAPEPQFQNARVENSTPTVIEITYDIALANIIPSGQAFSVQVNSTVRSVSSVSVSGNKVSLTLSSPLAFGDVITVAYTKPASQPLQSPQGGEAASYTAKAVTNNIAPPLPVFQSARIENSSPAVLVMTYNLSLASVIPATSAFRVMVNGTERSVTNISVSGTEVRLTLSSAVVYGDSIITVSYTKPASNPLQTSQGGQAESISSRPVTNNVNAVRPEYVSSVIENANPNILEITFDKNLANIIPPASSFTVMVNSINRTVNNVTLSGNKVVLTLSGPVEAGNTVTVSYTKPASNALKAEGGEEANNFNAKAVTNRVVPPVPVYQNSSVEDENRSQVLINYNLVLTNIIPPVSAFTVMVNSTQRSISSVSILGSRVTLTLSGGPLAFGDNITVSYTKPGTNPIQTAAGGQAASFSSQVVTNNIKAPVPAFVSATINNSSPSVLEMVYDLPLQNPPPAVSAFTVRVNNITRTVNSVVISGSTVRLTLSSPVVYGDNITVSYTKPGTNPIQTAAGGQAASFSSQVVTNNIKAPIPAFVSATINNSSPSILEIVYDLPLQNPPPAISAFTVHVNNIIRTVNSVVISGSTVRLTLSSPAVYGDNITVSYTKPGTNPIQTAAGGQAASFSSQVVTNNIKAPIPAFISATINNSSPSVLEMVYDLPLQNPPPAASAFTVLVNNTTRTVNSVAISGSTVRLTLSSPVVYGDNITVSYTKPANNPLKTADGGEAADSGTRTVTNLVQPEKPVFEEALIENANPSIIEVNFTLPLANIIPAANSFTVMVNSLPRAVNSISISGNKVFLTLAAPVAYGNNVSLAYTKPASSPLQSTDGGQVDNIDTNTVLNNILPPIPVFVNASVENASPDIIRLNYDLALANIIPAVSAFSVTVNSIAAQIQNISVSGKLVTLKLNNPVAFGDVVNVSYNKPPTGGLQTPYGGIALSFSNKTVKNNVYPPELIYISSVVENSSPSVLEILYNLELDNQLPAVSSYTVKINSLIVGVTAVNIEASKVRLSLASPAKFGDNITFSYSVPAVNPLQSTDGEEADPLTDQQVKNNILPPNPQLLTAVVENSNPSVIELTYDLPLVSPAPSVTAFTVRVNNVTRAVSSVIISAGNVRLTLASPVAFGNNVSLSYTKPSTNPLRTADGGQAATVSNHLVINNILPEVPVFNGASVENASPSVLEMNFSIALANITPAVSAFNVMVNSVPRAVNSISISGKKVFLTLAAPVAYGESVSLAYMKPASSPLQSTEGGQVDNISTTVENNILPEVPVFNGASVENASPSVLEMNFNIALANITPAVSAFTVMVNSVPRAVNSISISGNKVFLTLAAPVAYGESVSLAYTKPASSPLQSTEGGQVDNISTTVENNILPEVPVFNGASVENASPSVLEMNFNIALANITPAVSAFTVMVNSVPRAVNSISISGNKVFLTLAAPVAYGESVSLAYTKPASSPLQSTEGGQVDNISTTVENNILPEVPVFNGASVENASPSVLEMNFNIALANITPAVSAFNVMVNSVPRAVNSISISGNKVFLTLAAPIAYGESVSLSYMKPASSPLQSTDGGQVDNISTTVENNILPEVPVFTLALVANATPSRIEISYNLNLANIVPNVSAFTVLVNGNAATINSINISASKVHLNLSAALKYGDIITVSYNPPAHNPLQTTEGAKAGPLNDQPVSNNILAPVPIYQSSVIENSNPSLLLITYNPAPANIVPPESAFTVRINSIPVAVTSVAISGNKIILSLERAATFGDIITVAYTRPSNNPVQTPQGGLAESTNARNVTNNVEAAKPIFQNAVIENNSPALLEMNYDLPLLSPPPSVTAFTVFVNSIRRNVTGVGISGNKVRLNLESAVVYNDIVTVSYNKPSANALRTNQGAEAAEINKRPVNNKVEPVLPLFQSAVIENNTPDLLEINFNIPMAGIIPDNTSFIVKVDGQLREVTSVSISNNKVILSLSEPALYGNRITVSYNKPASNPLQSTSGVQANSFMDLNVTNNCLDIPKLSESNRFPVIILNYSASAYSGFEYEIDASETYDPDDDTLSFEWIVPADIPVSSKNGSKIRFLAPMVSSVKNYEFKLRVTDDQVVVTRDIPIKVMVYKPGLAVARLTNFEVSDYSSPDYPRNVSDGDINTKWSAYGSHHWIQFQLGSSFHISHIEIAFLKDQKYASYFDLYVSKDNITWVPVFINRSSCDFSGEKQIFTFPAINSLSDYSYIKINARGNEENEWNNFSEIKVYGTYPERSNFNPNQELNIMIYPNPSTGHFNISIEEPSFEPDRVMILDMNGRLVFEDIMFPGINTVHLPEHTRSGMYLVQLMSKNLIMYVEKLIVTKMR